MKSSFFNKSVMGVILLGVLTLAACAKKEDSYGRVGSRTNGGITQNDQQNAAACSGDTNKLWGRVFDPNYQYNGVTFENQAKDFLSAIVRPSDFGTISGNPNGNTGINVMPIFKFDSSGNITSGYFKMKIYDSYAGTTQNGVAIAPFEFEFNSAQSGHLDRNMRQFTVTFADSAGTVTFSGSYDGRLVQGTVTFKNSVNVEPNESPKQGTLGAFTSYQCATIQ